VGGNGNFLDIFIRVRKLAISIPHHLTARWPAKKTTAAIANDAAVL